MSDHSIVDWVSALRSGDAAAATQLWERVFPSLVRIARSKLAQTEKRISDEEDVALSVFNRLCENVDRTIFKKIENDDGLWKLLVRMTGNRVIDLQRELAAAKRGGGKVRGDSVFQSTDSRCPNGLDVMDAAQMGPDFEMLLVEEHQRLFGLLPDPVFIMIAEMKMQGYSNREIARKCLLTERSINRKLAIIKDLWIQSTAEPKSDSHYEG